MAEQPHAQLLRSELKPDLEENLDAVRAILNVPVNQDVVLRRFRCGGFEACAAYIEGMADDRKISEFLLHACKEAGEGEPGPPEDRARRLMERYVEAAQCACERRMEKLISGVLGGMTAVLLDGCGEGLLLETRGFVHRPVDKTSNEAVVIGSQEGFVESLRANITLVRRYVQSAQLVTERLAIGTGVPTNVALMYLKGVCEDGVVERGAAPAPAHRQPERAGNRRHPAADRGPAARDFPADAADGAAGPRGVVPAGGAVRDPGGEFALRADRAGDDVPPDPRVGRHVHALAVRDASADRARRGAGDLAAAAGTVRGAVCCTTRT